MLGPLLKIVWPLTANVLKPLAEGVLVPLGLTAAAATTDSTIQKTFFGSERPCMSARVAKVSDLSHPSELAKQTTLIISNEEMNDIMEIVKFLNELDLLVNVVSETIKNDAKEQKGGLACY